MVTWKFPLFRKPPSHISESFKAATRSQVPTHSIRARGTQICKETNSAQVATNMLCMCTVYIYMYIIYIYTKYTFPSLIAAVYIHVSSFFMHKKELKALYQ